VLRIIIICVNEYLWLHYGITLGISYIVEYIVESGGWPDESHPLLWRDVVPHHQATRETRPCGTESYALGQLKIAIFGKKLSSIVEYYKQKGQNRKKKIAER
jgi:hypothetical protein